MTKAQEDNLPNLNERYAQAQNRLIEHLQRSEKRYSDLVEHLRDVVFQIDADFNWVFINKAWQKLSGYPIDLMIGRPFVEHLSQSDSHSCISGFNALLNAEREDLTLQIELISSDKKCHTLELSCRAFKDELGKLSGIAGILSDITERIVAQQKITHLAYHDSLTGLANRRLLLAHLEQKLALDMLVTHTDVLIFIDLDGFKQINDTYGHFVGDALLINVAQKIKYLLKDYESLISRIGGDEFVICLSFPLQNTETGQQYLLDIVEGLRQSLAEKETLENVEVSITASIGVLLLDSKKMDSHKALTCVDAAMYAAKRQGRNCTRLYDQAFEREERELKKFKEDIETAVKELNFLLYYQPQVDIEKGELVKVEALIRWNHSVKGIIPPDDFVPYLEQSGLILDVGAWVLEESCRQLNVWITQGINHIVMSVNVSAYQFMQVDFISNLSHCLDSYSIPPYLLELELTEGVAIGDVELAISKMQRIRQLGVKIALDDFGTGYSSLAYLKNFPVDTLKIDRSFVSGIASDGYDEAIIKTTLVMAKHLNLTVVAEGVEDSKQLELLRELECDLYQGFLFSRPLTAKDMTALLMTNMPVANPKS